MLDRLSFIFFSFFLTAYRSLTLKLA